MTRSADLRPLRKIRVLDLSSGTAGRYCARLLGDAGAEVLRRPGQSVTPEGEVEAALEAYVDRGKLVIRPDEQLDWNRAVAAADVVVHDSPEGDIGLPFSARELLGSIPHLVVVSITPFGETGSKASWKGDDLIAVAAGGLCHATPGLPDYSHDLELESPLRPDALVGELMGGVHGAAGAILALLARDRDARGRYVEVSLQEVVAALIPWDIALWTFGGNIVGRRHTRAHLGPNAFLPAADSWVVLVAFAESHWRSLLEMMGTPDWGQSELFGNAVARGENWEALEALLADWLQTQGRWEFLQEAQRRGIPSAPTLELPDALGNEHMRARSFLVGSGKGKPLLPGNVFVIGGERQKTALASRTVPAADLALRWSPHTPLSRTDSRNTPLALPLSGIRVADFSQFVAMPLASQWLAMMGAEVILIESHHNLHSRPHAPFRGEPDIETGGIFNSFNNCKKSVTLNLRTPEGVALAKRLVARSDLVVENFSPGTMEKLHLGYAELSALNPGLVMVSLSAFGACGPWCNFASFHSGVVALSGFAAVTGYDGGPPRILGAVAPDTIAASYCFLGVLQGLYSRRLTGRGQHVEIAMSETLQSVMPEAIAEFGITGREEPRRGNHHRWKIPHGVYRCKGDDAWVAISVSDQSQWRGLVQTIGLGDEDGTWDARNQREAEIDAAIARWAKRLTAGEAAERLQQAGVPASPVANARDIVEDLHLLERGSIVRVDHPKAGVHRIVGAPWHMHPCPPLSYRHAPLFGEDTTAILTELMGLTGEEITALAEKKVVW